MEAIAIRLEAIAIRNKEERKERKRSGWIFPPLAKPAERWDRHGDRHRKLVRHATLVLHMNVKKKDHPVHSSTKDDTGDCLFKTKSYADTTLHRDTFLSL